MLLVHSAQSQVHPLHFNSNKTASKKKHILMLEILHKIRTSTPTIRKKNHTHIQECSENKWKDKMTENIVATHKNTHLLCIFGEIV